MEIVSRCVKRFRNYDHFKVFENFSLILETKEKQSSSENIENFRKVQQQNYSKIAKDSLEPFSSLNFTLTFSKNWNLCPPVVTPQDALLHTLLVIPPSSETLRNDDSSDCL